MPLKLRKRNAAAKWWGTLVASSLSLALAEDPDTSHREWQAYNGDIGGTKYSSLSQINRSNVDQLELVWRFRVGDSVSGQTSTIQCNPIVVDGIMYLTTPGQKAVALNAATGEKIWQFDPYGGMRGGGKSRGFKYWKDGDKARLFYGVSHYHYCLDAKTGRPVETFGDKGKIDLREGLNTDGVLRYVSSRAPGVIYKDLIILGNRVGEGPHQGAPGHVRAYDVRTGERKWIFHTIPHPGEFGYETWSPDSYQKVGGTNPWGGLTLDKKRGIVYMATGSATYDHWGGDRIGDNLFANCILALNAETGERIWHFQAVRHDLWDFDLPAAPTLITAIKDGVEVPALAQPTKMGHMFVLHRETGEPIWGAEDRSVPISEIPGEYTSPTQPFPIKPPAYTKQSFTLDDVTDLSEESRQYVLKMLKDMNMKLGDMFMPPGVQPSIMLPQFNGGSEWPGAAFDPETRILYINSSNEAEWISMEKAELPNEVLLSELGEKIYQSICSNCHGFSTTKSVEGVNKPLPALRTVKDRLSEEQVRTIIEKGQGQMPSFASFAQVEKDGIIDFLFEKNNQEPISTEGLDLNFTGGIPWLSTGHHDLHDQNGYPVNKRPWGQLNALDMNTGDIKWQVPLGTYPELEAKGLPPTGTFNIGGPVVTAGGLIFIGATKDERFRAFDKETGEELWYYQMEGAGYATPATFEVDGRQYVVMAGGGGSILQTRSGDSYYCFALPE